MVVPVQITRVPVRALIEHIRTRLTNRIFDLRWLDTYSKNRALNKINSIIPRIGYAPWVILFFALPIDAHSV